MAEELMTQDESVSALLAYVFSGAIGSAKGKGASYALIEATPTAFSWSAALEDVDGPPVPVARYLVEIDRLSREVSSSKPIELLEAELSEAILSATGQHLISSERFTDGALSISYKVTVQESDTKYVVQLRHHGRVASMDSLMTLISTTIDPLILPVPPVYPIPGERQRQETTRFGRQITQLIPGPMASTTYPDLSHAQRLTFVRNMALAYQACWQIPLPAPPLIGELIATSVNNKNNNKIILTIGPDRHSNLGGPFPSVRAYLQAHIKASLAALEQQQGIEEYKSQYLNRIRDFVHNHMHKIPFIVETMPIVASHSDMGLHNIIVSATTTSTGNSSPAHHMRRSTETSKCCSASPPQMGLGTSTTAPTSFARRSGEQFPPGSSGIRASRLRHS